MTGNPALGRLFAAVIALIAGGAVLLQVLLGIETVQARGGSALEGVILVFSYFTVLTNTLVAIVSGASALLGERDGLLTRPGTRAAVAIYIFVVGVIFAALLTGLRETHGLDRLADDTLHRVVPVLFVLYWLLFVPKGQLRWRDPVTWLLYPLLYVAYSLLYGALTGRYLYPFGDVTVLGYGGALANGLVILAGFFVLGLIVVAIDRATAPAGTA